MLKSCSQPFSFGLFMGRSVTVKRLEDRFPIANEQG